MKKRLIYIGVALCLGLSANKVYKTFFADKPLAAVGECVEFHDARLGRVELKINKNYGKEDESDVTFSVETAFGK